MTDQTMTPEQALEWLEGLRNTTGDQVCAEIEAGKAAEAAQAFRAALEAAREDAERMKRDIADLYKVMPMLPITAETMEAATDWFERYCIEFYREISTALDAAIDEARGKEVE